MTLFNSQQREERRRISLLLQREEWQRISLLLRNCPI
jgi:hypothetical protein